MQGPSSPEWATPRSIALTGFTLAKAAASDAADSAKAFSGVLLSGFVQ